MKIIVYEDVSTKEKKNINTNNEFMLIDIYNNKDDYIFTCGCNKKTNMTINKKEDTIYFSTKQGEKKTHKFLCPFYGDSLKKVRGYYEDNTGDIYFNVSLSNKDKNIIDREKEEEINKMIRTNPEALRSYVSNSIVQNKLTFRGFVEKMMTETWNRYYSREYNSPNYDCSQISIESFLKFFYGKSNQFFVNGDSVFNMLNKINDDTIFGYGVIEATSTDEIIYDLDTGTSSYLQYLNTRGEHYRLRVRTVTVVDAINSLGDIRFEKLIVAFTRNNKTKNKLVTNLVFLPINKYGLFSESSLECRYYNCCVENGLLFEKPYEIVEEYGYVPDAIISKDSKYYKDKLDKDIIVEIFGVENNEYYDKLKEEKKMAGNELNKGSNLYKFRYFPKK